MKYFSQTAVLTTGFATIHPRGIHPRGAYIRTPNIFRTITPTPHSTHLPAHLPRPPREPLNSPNTTNTVTHTITNSTNRPPINSTNRTNSHTNDTNSTNRTPKKYRQNRAQRLKTILLDGWFHSLNVCEHNHPLLMLALKKRLQAQKDPLMIPKLLSLIESARRNMGENDRIETLTGMIDILAEPGDIKWTSHRLIAFEQIFKYAIQTTLEETPRKAPNNVGLIWDNFLEAAFKFDTEEARTAALTIAETLYHQYLSDKSGSLAQECQRILSTLHAFKHHRSNPTQHDNTVRPNTVRPTYTEAQQAADWAALSQLTLTHAKAFTDRVNRLLPYLTQDQKRQLNTLLPQQLTLFRYNNYVEMARELGALHALWLTLSTPSHSTPEHTEPLTKTLLSAFDNAPFDNKASNNRFAETFTRIILLQSMAENYIKCRPNLEEHGREATALSDALIADLNGHYSFRIKSRIVESLCSLQATAYRNMSPSSSKRRLQIEPIEQAIIRALESSVPITLHALYYLLTSPMSDPLFYDAPSDNVSDNIADNAFLNALPQNYAILSSYFDVTQLSMPGIAHTVQSGLPIQASTPLPSEKLNHFISTLEAANKQHPRSSLTAHLLSAFLEQASREEVITFVTLCWQRPAIAALLGGTAHTSMIDISKGGDNLSTFAYFLDAWRHHFEPTDETELKAEYRALQMSRMNRKRQSALTQRSITPLTETSTLNIHGRTVTDIRTGLSYKIPKAGEHDHKAFEKEEDMTRLISALKEKAGLLSHMPEPIGIQWVSLSGHLVNHIRSKPGITLGATQNIPTKAYGYTADPTYHKHIYEATTLDEFNQASQTCLHDRAVLARHNLLPDVIASVFHNAKDQRSYHWDADRLGVAAGIRFGTGRHDAWYHSTEYTNLGLSGNRDLKHFSFLSDHLAQHPSDYPSHDRSGSAYTALTSLMGDTLYEWSMTVGRWFLDHNRLSVHGSSVYDPDSEHQAGTDTLTGTLADTLEQGFTAYFSAYTQKPVEQSRQFLRNIGIDWTRLARQMAYFMSKDYVSDIAQGRIAKGIYDEQTHVHCDLHTEALPYWSDKKGFCANGEQADLGPYNGPNPLTELIRTLTLVTALAPWVAEID